MTFQPEINFCDRVENNHESNVILQANKDHINGRCREVLELLEKGVVLTVLGAAKEYNITSLPRRIKDLRDKKGVPVKDRLVEGKFKEYYL